MNELQKGMRWFVQDEKVLHSLSVAFGDGESASFFYENADNNTLYDLASLTKLFTLIALMQLHEAGKLDLSAPIVRYDRRFVHIGGLSVESIMAFQENIITASRIDAADSREAALKLLFEAKSVPQTGIRFYSDMHAMVLKYVVESAAGMAFFDYLAKALLKPLHMDNTFARVPSDKLAFTQSYDREHRIESGQYLIRSCPVGLPHDPKAALLCGDAADLCGHAGLFSTLHDMALLCRALLRGGVLSPASLARLAVNRTGRLLPSGGHTQYLGYLCFVKHPNQYFSEIPAYMTDSAFGLSGFTGNHLSIDPNLNAFNVFLGNRCLNRLTVLLPQTPENWAQHGVAPDGTGLCRWPDGEKVFSSVHYVHQKDKRLHAPIAALREMI